MLLFQLCFVRVVIWSAAKHVLNLLRNVLSAVKKSNKFRRLIYHCQKLKEINENDNPFLKWIHLQLCMGWSVCPNNTDLRDSPLSTNYTFFFHIILSFFFPLPLLPHDISWIFKIICSLMTNDKFDHFFWWFFFLCFNINKFIENGQILI